MTAMTEDEQAAYRQAVIKELIGVAAYMLSLMAFQATIDPVFRELWKARVKKALGFTERPGTPEPPREWVRSIYDDLREGVGDGSGL
jgi:hypothetical protein